MSSKIEVSQKAQKSLIEKALTKGEPGQLDRDDVLDIIFWFRLSLGLFIGTTAGVLGLTGFPVIGAFGVLLFGCTWLYYSRYLEIDEQDFNEQELLMEGTGNAVGMFMLSWILVYSFKWKK